MATDASFYDDNWTVLQKIKYLAKWFKDNSVDADTLTFDEVNGNVVIKGKNFLGEDVNVLNFPVSMLPKGEKGEDGKDGINGTNGVDGQNGADGVGIDSIVDIGHTEVGNETVTTLQVNYTEGKESSTFEIHAQNGSNGVSGGTGIVINAPSTATNGTLTESQLNFLNESENNYIIFDNEKYYLMDKNHETGYLVYSHVGHNSTDDYKIKCITVTTTTRGWQLNESNVKKLYKHNFVSKINIFGDSESTILFELINSKSSKMTYNDVYNYMGEYLNITNTVLKIGSVYEVFIYLTKDQGKLSVIRINNNGSLSNYYLSTINDTVEEL